MIPERAELVIIPALGGSRAMLEPLLRRLPAWLHPTVLEPPGFGDAPTPRGLPSTRRLARAAQRQWPAGADARTTYLFGISLGGMVAQWLALDAPERMAGLLLASTTWRGLGALASVDDAVGAARNLSEPGAEAHAQLVADVVEGPEASARARAAARAHPRPKSDLLWLAAAAAAHAAPVEELGTPCVVITGSKDSLIKPQVQAELAEKVHALQHRVLDGIGHDLTLDTPCDCAQALAEAIEMMTAPRREAAP